MPRPPRLIAAAEAAPDDPATTRRLCVAACRMHGALHGVATLWGPCPAGPDDAPIFTAGPAYGQLRHLRAVRRALAAAEG